MNNELSRICFLDPIPQIAHSAHLLNEAVSAHLVGDRETADRSIRSADVPALRAWIDSIWGKNSPHVHFRIVPGAPPILPKAERVKSRMPLLAEKMALHARDGFQCRFCGIPVIRPEIRNLMRKEYPDALRWGETDALKHAAFLCLWAQYDHIVPHSRGGTNDLENMVIACSACNFGRMDSLIEEVGLADPRLRDPIVSDWDGLERFAVRSAADAR